MQGERIAVTEICFTTGYKSEQGGTRTRVSITSANPADRQSAAAVRSAAEDQQGVVQSQKGSSELRALPMTHGQLLADEDIQVAARQASPEPGAACRALPCRVSKLCQAAVAML